MGRKKKWVLDKGQEARMEANKKFSKPIISEMVKQIKAGTSLMDMKNEYVNSGRLTNYKFKSLIQQANKKIKERAAEVKDNILDYHMSRYEKIYEENFNVTNDIKELDEIPERSMRLYSSGNDFRLIQYKLGLAFDSLKSKEKLLGLHKPDVRVIVSETNVTIESGMAASDMRGFNTDRLSIDELFELRELLDKCRNENIDGVYPLIIKDVSTSIIFDKDDHEEDVDVEMTSPIDQMREETIQDIEFEEISDEEKYNKKLDKMKEKSLSLHKVKDKMEVSFLDIAREAFKDKLNQ